MSGQFEISDIFGKFKISLISKASGKSRLVVGLTAEISPSEKLPPSIFPENISSEKHFQEKDFSNLFPEKHFIDKYLPREFCGTKDFQYVWPM